MLDDNRHISSDRLRVDLSAGLGMAWFVDSPIEEPTEGASNDPATTEKLSSAENETSGNDDNGIFDDESGNGPDGTDRDNSIGDGAGDDALSGGNGGDALDGGDDRDSADYNYSSSDPLQVAWFVGDPNDPPGGGNDPSTEEEPRSTGNAIGTGGDDVLIGDANDNFIDGGGGADFIDGGAGDDTLIGGGGNDTLIGGDGNDLLEGGGGDDNLQGGTGDDTLTGGGGEDTFDGGPGTDTVDYSYTDSDRLRVDLDAGTAWFLDDPTSPPGGGNNPSTTERFINNSIENVIGGSGSNVIIGDLNDNVLDGGAGIDTIEGGDGNDTLIGGDDDDTFVFGTGFGPDIISDFDDAGSDLVDARGARLVALDDFYTLAGGNNLIDAGDSALGITVSDSFGDLAMDFGSGDILTFVTQSELEANDFFFG